MIKSVEKWFISIDQWLASVILMVIPVWVKPNYITITRIAAIYLVWYSYDYNPWVASAVCAAISITDYIDGRVARGRNLVTRTGKVLDIGCDQALLWSTVLLLMRESIILSPEDFWLFWLPIVMFVREMAVTAMRLRFKVKAADVDVLFLGRCKTASFMIGLCVLLTSTVSAYADLVGIMFLGVAAVCSLYSAKQYCEQFKIKAQSRKESG